MTIDLGQQSFYGWLAFSLSLSLSHSLSLYLASSLYSLSLFSPSLSLILPLFCTHIRTQTRTNTHEIHIQVLSLRPSLSLSLSLSPPLPLSFFLLLPYLMLGPFTSRWLISFCPNWGFACGNVCQFSTIQIGLYLDLTLLFEELILNRRSWKISKIHLIRNGKWI